MKFESFPYCSTKMKQKKKTKKQTNKQTKTTTTTTTTTKMVFRYGNVVSRKAGWDHSRKSGVDSLALFFRENGFYGRTDGR